ncbi:MAG: signal transduction histidine kinase, partial [Planctomycetota bacterium]
MTMSNLQGREWSLRSRMMRWLALTTGVVALVMSLTGLGFVHTAADRQAEALLQEELDEARVAFLFRDFDMGAFAEFATGISSHHPGNQLAWRVWSPDGSELIGEVGATETLKPGAPMASPLMETQQLKDGYRWRAVQLKSGHTIALLLNDAPFRRIVDQYIVVALICIAAGFASIFLVGRAFSTKLSGILSRIARRAREVQATTGTMELSNEDLPEEVYEVVEALEDMLHNIRSETEASRTLIAGMAHELRAPIQNMIGETEVTLMAENLPADFSELLASQLDEMRHMGDAVTNLVALCSARKAAEATQTESFDLFQEARFRLQREINRAERVGVEFDIEVEGDGLMRGDREAMLAAVRNFVSNALDWTKKGGR